MQQRQRAHTSRTHMQTRALSMQQLKRAHNLRTNRQTQKCAHANLTRTAQQTKRVCKALHSEHASALHGEARSALYSKRTRKALNKERMHWGLTRV
jgi:hypothetical protein